jgi:hypothetical protein
MTFKALRVRRFIFVKREAFLIIKHHSYRVTVSFHEAQNQSTSRNARPRSTELGVICTAAGAWGSRLPPTWSQHDSSKPVTKGRNSGSGLGDREDSKSQTYKFTNFRHSAAYES